MPLSFLDSIPMYLRGSPVSKIRQALAKCEAAGLVVTAADLEAHSLAGGGDPLPVAEALVTAHQLGVETSFIQLSALSLAGQNPPALVIEASKVRTLSFDTVSPQSKNKLRALTQDRTSVEATVTAIFRLSPMDLGIGHGLRHFQERLGTVVTALIQAAPDYSTLQHQKSAHKTELHQIGLETIRGLQSVEVEYRRGF